jgi:hypothetical protein
MVAVATTRREQPPVRVELPHGRDSGGRRPSRNVPWDLSGWGTAVGDAGDHVGDATRHAARRRHHRSDPVMSPHADVASRRPVHRSRTGHPTPWSRPDPSRRDRPTTGRRRRPAPPPVFVDDSGRRRRAGRLLGACLAALVLGYVGVVGLTFSGAPLVGRLSPPGIGELSRPAGDDGLDVGPGSQESPLPAAAVAPHASATEAGAPSNADSRPAAESQPAADPATTSATPTTTTTTPLRGQGTTTGVPTPSSTVPEHTHPTGGPPTEPPGKP